MKRFFKNFKKTPMLLVFIIILVFFTPIAIFSPGENKDRAVVTAVGIDRVDDEIELSLLTFIPTANPTYNETNSVISAKGSCIADALYQAQIAMGKRVGLSHARTTVVGHFLLEEDIAPTLDYLSRIASLSENTIFITTNSCAKDFLKASQTLGEDLGLKLDQLIAYDVKNVYVTDTTLESFYKGYFSDVRASLVGYLELVDENDADVASMESGQSGSTSCSGSSGSGGGGESGSDDGGGSGSGEGESSGESSDSSSSDGGQSGGNSGGDAGGNSGGEEGGEAGGENGGESGSSGQTTSESKRKIVNDGKVVLIKDGKRVEMLDEKIVEGLNIMNQKAIGQLIAVEHIEDDIFKDAKLTYAVRKKTVRQSLKMQNGNPILSLDVTLGLELIEIQGEKDDLKLNSEFTVLSKKIKDKIEAECKRSFAGAIKELRKNKADVINVTGMMMSSGGKFKEFYEKLENKEDILNNVNFILNINCKSE